MLRIHHHLAQSPMVDAILLKASNDSKASRKRSVSPLSAMRCNTVPRHHGRFASLHENGQKWTRPPISISFSLHFSSQRGDLNQYDAIFHQFQSISSDLQWPYQYSARPSVVKPLMPPICFTCMSLTTRSNFLLSSSIEPIGPIGAHHLDPAQNDVNPLLKPSNNPFAPPI